LHFRVARRIFVARKNETMKRFSICLTLCLILATSCFAKAKEVKIKLIETTDVHGSFFPYDFINRSARKGSLARVNTYVKQQREAFGKNLILLDNGDILQGQPICYYSNFIDTLSPNIASQLINYMEYDASGIGNHDIEPGHAVYDKWISEIKCPVLGANIIDERTGKPYVQPYTVFKRDGVKIAVIGMLTPAIPNWLPQHIWSGLRFEEMVSCARKWVDYVRKHEKADVIVGLFHSGRDGGIKTDEYEEDAALRIAKEVAGFDVVFFGHDHTRFCEQVTGADGRKVACLNPANNALSVAETTLTLQKKSGKWQVVDKTAELVDVSNVDVDEDLMTYFMPSFNKTNDFVNKQIGTFANRITTRDCYFGSSAFCDFILNLELDITGADIAFNAPLTFDTSIEKGAVYVSDMFKLYKFENMLYVLELSGAEIRKHLEMSYDLWVNTMKSPDDHLLLLSEYTKNDQQRLGFKNFTFNFDSAAGIIYEVDVTKPDGEKVKILSMADGTPFDETKTYRVAMNSYRANGGGELLTKGAGIAKDELEKRIVWRSDRDQRYYLMKEIEKRGTVYPKANNNWRFVPEELVAPAAKRDRALLFRGRR